MEKIQKYNDEAYKHSIMIGTTNEDHLKVQNLLDRITYLENYLKEREQANPQQPAEQLQQADVSSMLIAFCEWCNENNKYDFIDKNIVSSFLKAINYR